MYEATIAVRSRRDGVVSVINLSDFDATQHDPVIPDVTGATRTAAHTKQDTDRAIAKEIYGRHRF